MAPPDLVLKNRQLRMEGTYKAKDIFLKSARVVEKMSTLTETKVEFLAKDKKLELKEIVGTQITLLIKDENDKDRKFIGWCVSAEYIGLYQGYGHFIAELRPWLWFLTRTAECRIFQDLSAVEIIESIFRDSGFSDYELKLSGSYAKRTYCVQYRESNFDFISRLMEEEGIYYYFTAEGGNDVMVLADGIQAHKPTPGGPAFEFQFREKQYRRKKDHIFDWNAVEQVVSGKVTLNDYNFENPRADQAQSNASVSGKHKHTDYEVYDYQGHYRVTENGAAMARTRLEAKVAEYQRWRGVGNVRTMGVGQTMKLTGHPRVKDADEFLILSAVHHLQIETDYEDDETVNHLIDDRLEFDPDNKDTYRCNFEVLPKKTQYRAPQITPWPEIAGLQTAVVTGPNGEEIHTDKYGRIKVQFHWDRQGENDEKTSCWVRTVMPWTGKNWGMIAVPRIGQEVVIQFEEGDPDRPICTGMLYNGETMPPYTLPDNPTQTGIVTRSSKSGSASTFNELVFEDKKDAEFVRMQSEKDYKQIIKNNAEITIGLEKKDDGDLTQTIHRHKTETIKTGDKTCKVEEGNEIRSIAQDQTEDIGANLTQNVGADLTRTVGANEEVTIGTNLTESVGTDMETSVGSNLTITAGADISETAGQKVTITAGTEILLEVGGSSIKIDNKGVTINGKMVTINGDMLTEVKGGTSLILKGGMTMIN